MPDTPSIVLVKSMSYRDKYEEFSNRYHFSGPTPADDAAWSTLALDIFAKEGLALTHDVHLVRAYGYKAGTEHSIAQIDYAAPGPPPAGGFAPALAENLQAGDAAATIRWETGELNSRGKKIYCRKYFHVVYRKAATTDMLDEVQAAFFLSFAEKMIDGSLPNGVKYCGPQGAVLSNPYVDPWLTTRTLKRRGKRPLPGG